MQFQPFLRFNLAALDRGVRQDVSTLLEIQRILRPHHPLYPLKFQPFLRFNLINGFAMSMLSNPQVSTLLEIQQANCARKQGLLSCVSTLLEIQPQRVLGGALLIKSVSTLLEIQRLMCSVVVGF